MSASGVDAARLATASEAGQEAWRLVERLYPILRSITGDGVRQTLGILREHIPLELHEVRTGTPVLDWTVPQEWNVREAWIADSTGRRIVDLADHSLHLMSYSVPFRGRMSLDAAAPAPVLAARAARPDPVPHLLLRGTLGLLPPASRPGGAAGGRVRGLHRQHARRRPPHLWRAHSARTDGGRGAGQRARLPPLARQRQPVVGGALDASRPSTSVTGRPGSPTDSCSCPA